MTLWQRLFWLLVFVLATSAAPITAKLMFMLADLLYVWVGLITFLILYICWFKRRLGFMQTLDHEMSHMLVSLLFGNTMVEMYVHDRMGGHVKYSGRGHVLISLAPYVLRLPVLAAILLSVLVQAVGATKFSHIFAGAALCYAVISICEEARPYQTDLKIHGLWFSYPAVIALNILWLGFVASVLLPNISTLDYAKAIVHW